MRIDEAEGYGEAVASEREALVGRIKTVCDEAISKMKELMSKGEEPADFVELTETVEKFDSFPEETREAYKELQTHYDGVLEKTKETLRGLIGGIDPIALMEGLNKYEEVSGGHLSASYDT
jgi:hypothetical protein